MRWRRGGLDFEVSWHQMTIPRVRLYVEDDHLCVSAELSSVYGEPVVSVGWAGPWRRPRPWRASVCWPRRFLSNEWRWWRRDLTLERPLPEAAPVVRDGHYRGGASCA